MIEQLPMLIPAARKGSLWLPEQASTVASSVDFAWWLVYWISVGFFVLVVAVQAYMMFMYRRRPGHKAQLTPNHHYPLELTWSILPAFIIVVMFVKGVDGFLDMRTPPADTYDIEVVAKKWNWTFIYPNGIISPELHVPKGENVKLVMSSEDVIHSLFIPAFRVKQDIVPGRYNYLWFNATKEGKFDLYCSEYCGTNHSEMLSHTFVHDQQGLDEWFAEQIRIIDSMPPIELGEKLYNERGCSQCHATTDERRVGPGFAQSFGVKHEFADGANIEADENYIRESIVNPQAHVRAGFPGTMPTYKGMLRPAELRGLVAFVKSRNPEYREEAEKQFAKPANKLKDDEQKEADKAASEGQSEGATAAPQDAAKALDDPETDDVIPGARGGEPPAGR